MNRLKKWFKKWSKESKGVETEIRFILRIALGLSGACFLFFNPRPTWALVVSIVLATANVWFESRIHYRDKGRKKSAVVTIRRERWPPGALIEARDFFVDVTADEHGLGPYATAVFWEQFDVTNQLEIAPIGNGVLRVRFRRPQYHFQPDRVRAVNLTLKVTGQ